MSKPEVPDVPANCFQRKWDFGVTTVVHQDLLSRCMSEVDIAWMKATGALHSGDWLNAPPMTAVGLGLSDITIRVAVGYRLGSATCQPHACVCGIKVVVRGLQGLSCRKSTSRHIRHSQLNDLIWRVVRKVQIQAVKEQLGLTGQEGKRPDSATLILWAQGKPLAWDVTVLTFLHRHIKHFLRSSRQSSHKQNNKIWVVERNTLALPHDNRDRRTMECKSDETITRNLK